MPDTSLEKSETIISCIFDLDSSYNKKILTRSGKDWDTEFVPSFTIDELFQMRDYLYCHPIATRYDFNDYCEVSELIYDYIKWWVYDLIREGEIGMARFILNAAYI